ncbi:metal ABC transporter ATP-binding protein [Tissierella praeacuta]|uniref:metal ABC transporter ATP-binding protein n=1 Tax=Tissierella praeacuta TaxID=43131 RepID=UPI00333F77CC
MSLIICRDVSFAYEGKIVINNLNFHVEMGNYLCIVGENGSGKSTLIKGLLRLKAQEKGEILTGDGLKFNEIGYLPQQSIIQKDFPASVYEVVLSGCLNNLGLRPFYGKKEKLIANKNITRLGLNNIKNSCYRELSGGQQQRVLLARALCSTKKLLLLDEPVAGLDPLVTQELYSLIKQINEDMNITIIMVSHDIGSAVQYASHILHLKNEQLFYGKTRDYMKSEIGNVFLGGRQNG